MLKKILFLPTCIFATLFTKAQNEKSFGQVNEISRFINYFENTSAPFFQTKAAKDSILFLMNNESKILEATQSKKIDSQKVVFNRIILSLELFFSADQIEGYAFDSIYRTVPFLRKIYKGYLNYSSKDINSFTSQEGVALMYQSELYLYFNDNKTYLKNIKLLLDYIQRLSSRNVSK